MTQDDGDRSPKAKAVTGYRTPKGPKIVDDRPGDYGGIIGRNMRLMQNEMKRRPPSVETSRSSQRTRLFRRTNSPKEPTSTALI
jgi:hypothetical protein